MRVGGRSGIIGNHSVVRKSACMGDGVAVARSVERGELLCWEMFGNARTASRLDRRHFVRSADGDSVILRSCPESVTRAVICPADIDADLWWNRWNRGSQYQTQKVAGLNPER